MPTLFRACVLAAVSTPSQAKGISIPTQIETGQTACANLGATIVATIVIPGHSRDYVFLHELVASCPEYRQIVDLIESEAINLLVCWRFDRLWRNDWIRADVMRLCTIHKVQVYSTEQPKMPVPPDQVGRRAGYGQVIEVISGLASEDEQKRRMDRLRMGMQGRIAKGRAHSGPNTPYGYHRETTGWQGEKPIMGLVVDEDEAYWVRYIFERRAVGHSTGVIAGDLTRLNVPPPGSNRPALAPRIIRHMWHPRTVQRILVNPAYIGVVRWGAYVNENGIHQPIIERELWDRVQTIMAAGPGHVSPKTYTGNWLVGLLRCGFCGHSMVYYRTNKNGRRLYLRCGFYVESHASQCRNNGHSAAKVHTFVQDRIIAALHDPTAWAEARKAQRDTAGIMRQLEVTRTAIAANRARWQRAYAAYEAGAISLDEMVANRARLDGEYAELQATAQEMNRQLGSDQAVHAALADYSGLADTFSTVPPDIKAQVAVGLIRRVILQHGLVPVIEWW